MLLSALTLALVLGGLELLGVALDPHRRRSDALRALLLERSRRTEPITRHNQLAVPWRDPGEVAVRRPEDPRNPAVTTPAGYDPFGDVAQRSLVPARINDPRKVVWIVGGSAAYGFPYRYEASLAVQLQARLGRGYRVINAAQPGWSSGQLVEVVRRVARSRPHAVLLFVGNNEWFHWGPGAINAGSGAAIPALRMAARSRLLAVVAHALLRRKARLQQRNAAGRAGKARRQPEYLRSFDAAVWFATKQRFLRALEANLSQMINLARSSGARVYLLTMPFNYRLSYQFKYPQPRSFRRRSAQAVRDLTRRARRALDHSKLQRCLQLTTQALALDPHPPRLHHLRGRCLRGAGRLTAAEEAFARSRENMVGSLGSVLSVNLSIARAARVGHAELIDIKRLFDEHSHAHGRYFNQGLIQDERHPTPAGHVLIAGAVARRLACISHHHLLRRAIAAQLRGLLPAPSSTHRKCACGGLRSEVREDACSHPPRDGVGAGWPQAVARPGLPQIRTCGIPASGSSSHGFANRR